ncbi:MAG: cell division protein ZapA [Acidobacteria bacterium]|nr:cell division protein ZapA [Acidobacteriota bacterium]
MGETSESITEVKIFNQTYSVRGRTDSDYIRELANYVHGKMTEVSEYTSTVDSLKVAVLAALNIADELFLSRQELAVLEKKRNEELAELSSQLEPLLEARLP